MQMNNRSCPRLRYTGKSAHRFLIATDPAVQELAHMVVAGIDRKYELHPCYEAWVKIWGKEKAEGLIRHAVEIPGACDVIQTHEIFENRMGIEGFPLFGGLSKDEKEFIFYEWGWSGRGPRPRMLVSMTHQEAREIVSGKKKTIKFQPDTRTSKKETSLFAR